MSTASIISILIGLIGVISSQTVVKSQLASRSSNVNAASNWDHYSQVFGTLGSVFRSSDTLDHMVAHETQLFDTQAPPQYACSSYSNGHIIAKFARTEFLGMEGALNSIVRPYFVSEKEDKMCFAMHLSVSLPTEISSLFNLVVPVSPTLKIDPSIYSILDNPSSGTLLPKLSVSFLMNSTSHETNPELGNAGLLYKAISELSSYKAQLLDSFFWTSSSSSAYFSEESISLSADGIRFKNWRTYSTNLQSVITSSASDPCGFKTMKIEKHMDRFLLDLTFIRTLNQTLQSSCIAFIGAVISQQPTSWTLTLSDTPQVFNYRSRSILETATVGSDSYFTPYTRLGLRGDGQVASIADTGVDMQSCYFIDTNKANAVAYSSLFSPVTNLNARVVVQYTYYPGLGDTQDFVDGHGTHVAGSVVGNKLNANIITDGKYDGVAPNGKLAFMDLASSATGGGIAVPAVANLYGPGRAAGAKVHTNSWGTVNPSSKSYATSDTDQYLYDNMDMTIFFAAGNSGYNGKGSVSVESQAKNVVAVGASYTTYQSGPINSVSWFSSLGPSFDGRIKPDLVSTGSSVLSAESNAGRGQTCNTVSKQGTSMASPSAAGSALLVRQYFSGYNNNLWHQMCNPNYVYCKNFVPSGVLVKAILLHSGTQMNLFDGQPSVPLSSPPDFYQGYGRIQLLHVLPLQSYTAFDLYVDDLATIGEYSTQTYTVTVTNPTIPLKVTLSWYDPAAVTGATSSVLIHNLDLKVVSPSSAKYYGNGGSTADVLNNNEQVFIANPVAGVYSVTVKTSSLPTTGSQRYSLVITSGGNVTH